MSYPLDQVLLCACIEIDLMGWVSASQTNIDLSKTPTAWWVKQHIIHAKRPATITRQDILVEAAKTRDIDMFSSHYPDKVQKIIEWAKGLTVSTVRFDDDYDTKIRNLALCDNIEPKDFGFVCSMVTQYERKGANKTSKHIGTVGDIMSVEGKLTYSKGFADKFARYNSVGPIKQRYVLTITTNDGNVVKCWVSEDCATGFQQGDNMRVSGKIKSHGEYQGIAETTFNYVKLEKI